MPINRDGQSPDGYLGVNPVDRPKNVVTARAPTTLDRRYRIGTVWVNTAGDTAFFLTSVSAGSATWALASPGASDVDTINSLSPAAGNITIDGGTNLTDSNAGSTVTLNMDAAITLATSVTSALYTTAAATDLLVTAVTGQDIILKMGDAGGTNLVSFTDTADVQVASIDSDGAFTTTGLTFTGLLTANASATILTAGTTLNLGSDDDAAAVNLAVGTTARVVGIANSAAAHLVTIGSSTDGASLDLLVGTGNFTLEGANTSTYGISTSGADTGTISVGTGTGAQTLNLMTGGTGIKTTNISTGAIGNLVTIGSVTDASSLDLLVGTGNFTLEGNVASTYDISSTGINTGTCRFGSGTGARTVELAGGGTGIKTVNIAAASTADVVTIGTSDGAGSLALAAGTGNFTLEGDVATTFDISSTGVNTGTCRFGSGTGARTVELAGGGTGIKTVNIAAASTADVVTIGTSDGAGSLALAAGTGNFTLEGNVATTYDISSTGVNTGTCRFGSGTGVRTVEIAGGGTGIKTVNIAAASTADVVVIGTTTGAGSLTLAAGTGDITMSGTVKEIDAEFIDWTGDDITFQMSPIMGSALNTAVAATGATGDLNLMYCQQGFVMEQFVLGAGQTLIKPVMDANGLLISGDLTTTEGYEYNLGAARDNSRSAFTIGTDLAFFLEVRMFIADLSGSDPYVVGFRKTEANNATFATYDSYVAIGMNDTTSATNATIFDELNAGGLTLTDTTDAWGGDAAAQTVKILVSAAGVVTFEVAGSAAGAAPSFTFDNADVVAPFIRLTHNADAGAVNAVTWKCGFQATP